MQVHCLIGSKKLLLMKLLRFSEFPSRNWLEEAVFELRLLFIVDYSCSKTNLSFIDNLADHCRNHGCCVMTSFTCSGFRIRYFNLLFHKNRNRKYTVGDDNLNTRKLKIIFLVKIEGLRNCLNLVIRSIFRGT